MPSMSFDARTFFQRPHSSIHIYICIKSTNVKQSNTPYKQRSIFFFHTKIVGLQRIAFPIFHFQGSTFPFSLNLSFLPISSRSLVFQDPFSFKSSHGSSSDALGYFSYSLKNDSLPLQDSFTKERIFSPELGNLWCRVTSKRKGGKSFLFYPRTNDRLANSSLETFPRDNLREIMRE